jgi:alkylated DNA repair dioxygenase AlkB
MVHLPSDLPWQPSLLGVGDRVGFDAGFEGIWRVQLDDDCWVDHGPGWLSGSDRLFEELLNARDWGQRTRRIYDQEVVEPRLTSGWSLASGEPLVPPILEDMRRTLADRYGRLFDSVGLNLYRDGRDSVAWHGDRIPKEIENPIVALVSLGEPRRFLLRTKGGGPARAFVLGGGDLLVTGGRTQRDWEHSVPKVARAGPRISLAYRHGLQPPDASVDA